MELFVKIAKGFQPFNIFAENSILDDRLRFEYASLFLIRSIVRGKTSNCLFCQIFYDVFLNMIGNCVFTCMNNTL